MGLFKKINKRSIGDSAEDRAARYLRKQGHQILERNFNCRFGEIDLITRDRSGFLVFVEVRHRTDSAFASAAESITPVKQDRIRKTAQIYLSRHQNLSTLPCRFDVIALQQASDSRKIVINWLQNAFY